MQTASESFEKQSVMSTSSANKNVPPQIKVEPDSKMPATKPLTVDNVKALAMQGG